jgi:gliding motility-associated-like protein
MTAYDTCTAVWGFANASINAQRFVWSLGDGTSTSAVSLTHVYALPGNYAVRLIAFTADGCSDTLDVQVGSLDGDILPGLYVPNCFSPNGDGVNDRFQVGGIPECISAQLIIFNRWGEVVFEDSSLHAWNGTMRGQPVPDGVYVYVLRSLGLERYGCVTLLR